MDDENKIVHGSFEPVPENHEAHEPHKEKRHKKLAPKKAFRAGKRVVIALLVAVLLFWGGYQLAVYQNDMGNNFSLPHFDANPASDVKSCPGSDPNIGLAC